MAKRCLTGLGVLRHIRFKKCINDLGGGAQLNVDRRFDQILIVESTIIFRNSCRFVDRFFASKTCRL